MKRVRALSKYALQKKLCLQNQPRAFRRPALIMVLGFIWEGWTTSGRATVMTDIAVRGARADLAASSICVQKFVTANDAQENRAKSSWQRDDFTTDGGWAKIAGNAADACADRLLKMKELLHPGGDAAVTDS